jgi:hypothetical protein
MSAWPLQGKKREEGSGRRAVMHWAMAAVSVMSGQGSAYSTLNLCEQALTRSQTRPGRQ